MGKPTIGTHVAGIPEQINNNVNGYIVKPKDENDLSVAIQKLMNFKTINLFSLKAKEKFATNYTVNIIVKKYIDLYKSINQ